MSILSRLRGRAYIWLAPDIFGPPIPHRRGKSEEELLANLRIMETDPKGILMDDAIKTMGRSLLILMEARAA